MLRCLHKQQNCIYTEALLYLLIPLLISTGSRQKGDEWAASAFVAHTFCIFRGTAAALTVWVIGTGAAAPATIGVLGARAVTPLASVLFITRAVATVTVLLIATQEPPTQVAFPATLLLYTSSKSLAASGATAARTPIAAVAARANRSCQATHTFHTHVLAESLGMISLVLKSLTCFLCLYSNSPMAYLVL